MVGGREGSGSCWARAGGSRAAAHTLGAAAAAISQLGSRRRLPLRMRLRGPRAPFPAHAPPLPERARALQPGGEEACPQVSGGVAGKQLPASACALRSLHSEVVLPGA